MHKPNTITIDEKTYVLIPEEEYKLMMAARILPCLPPTLMEIVKLYPISMQALPAGS